MRQLRRALFVCDRDELRSQGLNHFQNVFGANAAEVTSANPQKNARILIATYQTLNVSSEVVDLLDIRELTSQEKVEGRPAYHPRMMLKILSLIKSGT